MLVVKVHAANIHDTMSGCHVYQAAKNKYPSIKGGCADESYRGTFVKFVKVKYGETIDISEKIKPKQWHIMPMLAVLHFYLKISKFRNIIIIMKNKVVLGYRIFND